MTNYVADKVIIVTGAASGFGRLVCCKAAALGARVVGGLSAGLAYPTTLALITALWSGPARTTGR